MKRPQPNLAEKLLQKFISDSFTVHSIKNLWGTATVNGVEVLVPRQYYYPSNYRSANFERLFRLLGIYDSVVTADMKGVESAWIYFNKNKSTSNIFAGDMAVFVANNLNTMWWDPADGVMPEGLTLTTSIIIQDNVFSDDQYEPIQRLPRFYQGVNEDTGITLEQYITGNYDYLWNNFNIIQQGIGVINKGTLTDLASLITVQENDNLASSDPWLSTIARNALRQGGIPCSIKKVRAGYTTAQAGSILLPTYVVTIEIPYVAFTKTSPLVLKIVEQLSATYSSKNSSNSKTTKSVIQALDQTSLVTNPNVITRPYTLWENTSQSSYENLWYFYNDTWYLRAQIFNNPRGQGIDYKDLVSYVLPLIDSGYTEEDVPWYQQVFAVVAFVIAFNVGLGGVALSAAQAVELATAVVIASAVVALLSIVLYATNNTDSARAFAQLNKTIEPLVIFATIVTLVASLTAIAKKGLTSVFNNMVADIVKGATQLASGQITSLSIQFLQKAVSLLTLPAQIALSRLSDRNKDLRSEYAKLEEETSRETDVMQDFMKIYPYPATADWSVYALEFDAPYERGGGNLSLGNVQRTTKQALRNGTYDDPVFENIPFMQYNAT